MPRPQNWEPEKYDSVDLPDHVTTDCCYVVAKKGKCDAPAQYSVELAYCVCGDYHPVKPMCSKPEPDHGYTYVCNEHALKMRSGGPVDWPNLRQVRTLAAQPTG